jgi:predicted house-cleaning NTP pyrophosphatase (Maf/HAM1 superfamily)
MSAERGSASPDEFPRRADASPLSTNRLSILPNLSHRRSFAKSYVDSNEKYEDEMEDPLELVYTISTNKLRKAHRSELLHHQDDGMY